MAGLDAYGPSIQTADLTTAKHGAGHVDDLAPLGHLGLLQRQRAVAAHALPWQRMLDCLSRLGDAFECRALVAGLAAGRLARRLAQRARLLGQPSVDGGLLEFWLVLLTFMIFPS